mmetsp:Transcript_1765/g.3028  ORF Transcript_1765/g.3028 Transcript_1765/m.3028 type:complete len:126 (-) Transcript_1765:3-380(-)
MTGKGGKNATKQTQKATCTKRQHTSNTIHPSHHHTSVELLFTFQQALKAFHPIHSIHLYIIFLTLHKSLTLTRKKNETRKKLRNQYWKSTSCTTDLTGKTAYYIHKTVAASKHQQNSDSFILMPI